MRFEIRKLTDKEFGRALKRSQRRRVLEGRLNTGDVAAVRNFVGMTQAGFARALGISIHTLRNWEQGRRKPEGPAVALLRIAARHPKLIRENVPSAT